jgi:hypothetical protein
MYAAGPILADQAVKSNMPTTTTRPGAVRTYSYNPYEQLYTPTGNYEVPVKAANGGLMGMNDGGYAPGQLNFAQRSEPVVRMAVGGTPPTYNSVEDLYKNILGREGEAEGLAFWKQGFGDTIDPNEVASFQQAAQAELARRPVAEQQQLAPNLVAANTATTGGVTNLATTGNAATTGGLDTLAAANNLTALQPQATTLASSVIPPPTQTSLADAQGMVNFFGFSVLNTTLYAWAVSASFLIVALVSPMLSAIADVTGRRLLFMKLFTWLGSLSCMALYFFTPQRLELGIVAFTLAGIGYSGSLVFYNCLLVWF